MKKRKGAPAGSMAFADAAMLMLCLGAALWVAPSRPVPPVQGFLFGAPLLVLIHLMLFWRLGLYKPLWRYAGVGEYLTSFYSAAAGAALFAPASILLPTGCPLSGTGCLLLMLLSAFGTLLLRSLSAAAAGYGSPSGEKRKRLLVVGAGCAASTLIGELQKNAENEYHITGALDDDPLKQGRKILGVPILGKIAQVQRIASEQAADEIIVAIPSATAYERARILSLCGKAGCRLKTLPNLYEMMTGTGDMMSGLRDVSAEELLGREPVAVAPCREVLEGRTVLITGAGGSIGGELSRQIAAGSPARLLLLDICENGVYELERELASSRPGLPVRVYIASVRDGARMAQIMEREKPDLVFHAAAHKHVPLMESNPCEAVKNNVFGTLCTARAALKSGVSRFVLISTDKAVNPTSVMGATKALCERLLPMLQAEGATEFVAVRFGNVLGSNGSVIPLFRRQIADGGPVTVTHPDITRYFMTIPEAASLVLRAAAIARGGEIFILDMGRPVRIRELAENLIRLSGYEPGREVKIVYTGLRPGEKLFEELSSQDEENIRTREERIFAASPQRYPVSAEALGLLQRAAEENDELRTRRLLRELVPEFGPEGEKPEVAKRFTVTL